MPSQPTPLRFTATHELGHLVLHRNVAPGDPQQEQEANVFAAEFLTPADQIRVRLPAGVDFKILEQISREWGVLGRPETQCARPLRELGAPCLVAGFRC